MEKKIRHRIYINNNNEQSSRWYLQNTSWHMRQWSKCNLISFNLKRTRETSNVSIPFFFWQTTQYYRTINYLDYKTEWTVKSFSESVYWTLAIELFMAKIYSIWEQYDWIIYLSNWTIGEWIVDLMTEYWVERKLNNTEGTQLMNLNWLSDHEWLNEWM